MPFWQEYQKNDMPFSVHHVGRHTVFTCLISGDVELDPLTKMISGSQALYLRDLNLVEMPLKVFLYQT